MATRKGKNSDEYKSVFGNAKRDQSTSASGANWADAPAELLWRLIDTVTNRGGAVRFGYTRDGGAYAVGFYYGNESTTEYCRPTEDLEVFIVKWIDFYANLPVTGGRSPASK